MTSPTSNKCQHSKRFLQILMVLAIAIGPVDSAASQERGPVPPVDVIADVGAAAECAVSKSSLIAVAKAALRYNRIDFDSDADFYLYVQVNAMPSAPTNCAASLDVSLRELRFFPTSGFPTSQTIFSVIQCEKGTLLNWNRSELQDKLNAGIRDLFDECLAEILDQ